MPVTQLRLHTPWLAKENENYLPGEWPCLNSHLQVLGRGHLGPSPTLPSENPSILKELGPVEVTSCLGLAEGGPILIGFTAHMIIDFDVVLWP